MTTLLFLSLRRSTLSPRLVSSPLRTLSSATTAAASPAETSTTTTSPLIRLENVRLRPFLPINSTFVTHNHRKSRKDTIIACDSLEIWEGRHYLILGRNGSGKTTLAKSLVNKCQLLGGSVEYREGFSPARNCEFVSLSKHATTLQLARRLNEFNEEREMTGMTELSSPLSSSSFTSESLEELMSRFGLRPEVVKRRNLETLSLGELRRMFLLKSILAQPRVLILDEVFDALDLDNRKRVADLLGEMARGGETTMVIVTHREEDVSLFPFLTDLVLFPSDDGGDPVTFSSDLPHEARSYRIRELSDETSNAPFDPRAFTHRYFSSSVPRAATSPSSHPPTPSDAELEVALNETLALARKVKSDSSSSSSPLVELREVSVNFASDDIHETGALRNVSLCVRPGDRWVITGKSGAGKSLLLEILAGESPFSHAHDVRRRGRGEDGTGSLDSLEERRREIGFVSPKVQTTMFSRFPFVSLYSVIATGTIGRLFPPSTPPVKAIKTTINEIMAEAAEVKRQSAMNALIRRWITAFLPRVAGLEREVNFHSLSQGEQQRALLIRALIGSPPLLLLDEPFTGLDFAARRRFAEVLKRMMEGVDDDGEDVVSGSQRSPRSGNEDVANARSARRRKPAVVTTSHYGDFLSEAEGEVKRFELD